MKDLNLSKHGRLKVSVSVLSENREENRKQKIPTLRKPGNTPNFPAKYREDSERGYII